MLLTVDVGNTRVNFALMKGNEVVNTVSAPSYDEPPANLYEQTMHDTIGAYKIRGAVFASVVKELDGYICKMLNGITPNVIKVDAFLKLKHFIADEHKSSIGADLVCTDEAASVLYGDCVIVDMGTATTLQVLQNKTLKGLIIAPGMDMGAKALNQFTSLLPDIKLRLPRTVLGRNTVECMQSGVIYGHAAMVEGLLARINKEMGAKFKTIATGGHAKIISQIMTTPFDVIDHSLIFKGMKFIYDNNKN